jgi:hypothetical protein
MSPQARLVAALSLILGAYAVSVNVTRLLIENIYAMHCTTSFLTTVCDYPADAAVVGSAQSWLALFLCAAGAACWFIRKTSAYPFLALAVLLCGSALAWDFLFQNPIIHGPKIVNDTLNILGAVIAASFVMIALLVRDQPYSLARFTVAVALSFGVKTLSSVAYVSLSQTLFGVTELFLLYVVYSFGSFTIHLMTICGFVGSLGQRQAEVVTA